MSTDDKLNGSGEPPKDATTKTIEQATQEAANEVLRRVKHAQWLGQFAQTLNTPVPGRTVVMTPFRAGAISRLKMASEFITLLQTDLFWLARDNKALRRQVEHLGGVAAAPFRPEAEKAALEQPLTEVEDSAVGANKSEGKKDG